MSKHYIRISIHFAAMMAGLFIPAGTLFYWQGWLYFGIFITLTYFSVIGVQEELRNERLKPGGSYEGWDKYFLAFYNLMSLLLPAVSSLDANRLKIFMSFTFIENIVGFICVSVCSIFIIWSIKVNFFFSSVVRVQKDRNQKVISNGPYSLVRHPGYLGSIIYFPSVALALGSVLGLLLSLFIITAFVIRTFLEDKFLEKELPGYKQYMKVVKFKLLPYVW